MIWERMGEIIVAAVCSIAGFLLEQILPPLLLYALVFPLLCLVCTPFVLINAFFGDGRYFQNAAADCKRICGWSVLF